MTRRTSAVIAEGVRRNTLAEYEERLAALSMATRGELSIRELPFVSQVNLRADPTDTGLLHRLASTLGGLAIPNAPNTVTSTGDRRALWLGPDEWLIVGPEGQQAAIQEALRVGLDDALGSIVDVSANRTVLEIRGARAPDVLAHGISIDLDPRSSGSGGCAQTLLAKAQVIIEWREEFAFEVYVRTSFADYLATWLLDATATVSSGW
jgi:sarcosine oxidase, subunit gamma